MVNVDLDDEKYSDASTQSLADGPYGVFICLEDEDELLDFTSQSDQIAVYSAHQIAQRSSGSSR